MNKKIIIAGFVLVALAFYGGMTYGQSKGRTSAQGFRNGNFTANALGARGARGALGGGFVSGDIIAKDATSITVGLAAGGSKIILISGNTPIMKTVSGTSADLTVGKTINANGTTNSDGSITAAMVSIRQATTTRQ